MPVQILLNKELNLWNWDWDSGLRPDLLDHGCDDHEDEGRHRGEGGHGGLGEAELDHRHDQEVEVGHPAELLQGVNQPEGEDVVLGALDEVVTETELEIKTWM